MWPCDAECHNANFLAYAPEYMALTKKGKR